MKLAIAQSRSMLGALSTNLQTHQRWVDRAVQMGADAIAFPELSLTGYAPTLAEPLAMSPTDDRLVPFQHIADRDRIAIGVGLPTRHPDGIGISLVWFHPHAAPQVYTKQYLHPDEEPFFVPGENLNKLLGPERDIALSICYEISVPEHAAHSKHRGANVYCASVAKTARGVQAAHQTLSTTAAQQGLLVLMANCVGPSGDGLCTGQSAAWDEKGRLLGKLDDVREGILSVDTDTRQVITELF